MQGMRNGMTRNKPSNWYQQEKRGGVVKFRTKGGTGHNFLQPMEVANRKRRVSKGQQKLRTVVNLRGTNNKLFLKPGFCKRNQFRTCQTSICALLVEHACSTDQDRPAPGMRRVPAHQWPRAGGCAMRCSSKSRCPRPQNQNDPRCFHLLTGRILGIPSNSILSRDPILFGKPSNTQGKQPEKNNG